ncbi:MAG: ribosome small subunit-dependent GTPase A [Lachnospiraceae bacterium]|nr:ribosome small subunit-dependent GTPase A [Lachnospiraceae bacterium]
MDLKNYGFMPNMMPENAQGIPARITAVHKERYALVCEYGETYGRLKTKEYFGGFEEFPTTGDFVLINYIPNGDSQIIKTLPRKTFFSRRDPTPGRGEQAVASNFDYVFIIQSLNHDFNAKRLERYLTLAWQSGAAPVVVLTKADLVDESAPYIRIVENYAVGVPVHTVSSKTGAGLNALSAYMSSGKTIVFLGSSGVGKSSLVNALADEEIMTVNGIREDDSKGRHTTTHRQLIMLKNGAMIIDTPGMRELGMWDVSAGLGEAFADVEQYLGKCKFSDCKHQTEPGCAIKEAIANGELSRERWKSYMSLKSEAKYSDDKGSFLRKKQQRNKNIAKYNRQKKSENKVLDELS